MEASDLLLDIALLQPVEVEDTNCTIKERCTWGVICIAMLFFLVVIWWKHPTW